MNVGSIAVANSKGQIVIPAQMRKMLNIQPGSFLKAVFMGSGIYVEPVKVVPSAPDSDAAYLAILEKTKGSWTATSADKAREVQKRKIELTAAEKRRNAW
jgi:AbrB family looped-hinge helix DNA binding protein